MDDFQGGPQTDTQWDLEKAAANEVKHGVSFTQAATVFADLDHLVSLDGDHSVGEYRYHMVGRSIGGEILFVVFTERPAPEGVVGETFRIISARRATKLEKEKYESEYYRTRG